MAGGLVTVAGRLVVIAWGLVIEAGRLVTVARFLVIILVAVSAGLVAVVVVAVRVTHFFRASKCAISNIAALSVVACADKLPSIVALQDLVTTALVFTK